MFKYFYERIYTALKSWKTLATLITLKQNKKFLINLIKSANRSHDNLAKTDKQLIIEIIIIFFRPLIFLFNKTNELQFGWTTKKRIKLRELFDNIIGSVELSTAFMTNRKLR